MLKITRKKLKTKQRRTKTLFCVEATSFLETNYVISSTESPKEKPRRVYYCPAEQEYFYFVHEVSLRIGKKLPLPLFWKFVEFFNFKRTY